MSYEVKSSSLQVVASQDNFSTFHHQNTPTAQTTLRKTRAHPKIVRAKVRLAQRRQLGIPQRGSPTRFGTSKSVENGFTETPHVFALCKYFSKRARTGSWAAQLKPWVFFPLVSCCETCHSFRHKHQATRLPSERTMASEAGLGIVGLRRVNVCGLDLNCSS